MTPNEHIVTVFQRKPTECAAACACMVMNYYGKQITLDDLCVEHPVSDDFCTAGDIIRIAKAYGFEAHGYKREFTQLENVATPVVLHWNFNHFVVLESFDGNYFYVNDPAVGRIRLTPDEVDKYFTGVCIDIACSK